MASLGWLLNLGFAGSGQQIQPQGIKAGGSWSYGDVPPLANKKARKYWIRVFQDQLYPEDRKIREQLRKAKQGALTASPVPQFILFRETPGMEPYGTRAAFTPQLPREVLRLPAAKRDVVKRKRATRAVVNAILMDLY